ncbi:hypothetical protein LEN26_012620 [Aphanomyces euteiches]|nr:hypothetical protein AeMF1_011685 [Aphanomyces euteiches]KAH9117531.1 hypothetical protein LEN26_012620 [Aphanomyces euteiches]KAH9187542.1 hypothetical protein AeNC1_010481 [Aphanomyces euteiches]
MGIRGLTAYVAERQAECADEIEDLKNVTLGVDLDSFLHFACRELVNGYNAQWLLLGGDARALYVWVRTWMRPLFSRKIRLKFVRDPPGMLNTIKDVTHVKRSKEKADKMLSVQNGLNDKTGPKDDPWQTLQIKDDVAKTLVEAQAVFTLARQTLVRCLQHAGCSIVTAPTEADETLGDMVRSKKIYAVLAHDSDYLMMHKMRYIPFNSIRVNAESGVVSATVFVAEKLAACSSLAPDKLIEWAIVCGNDFTPYVDQHFGLAEKLHLPLLRQSQGYFNVGDALMWLQEHLGSSNWLDDPVFRELLKNNPDLLRHVYGIYCFYGAGDIVISRFPSATRHKVLKPEDWKQVSKMLDKFMLPSFTIDVMYKQRRMLSWRSKLIGLSCPILDGMRQSLYRLMGQTQVEECEMDLESGEPIVRVVTLPASEMHIKTIRQHSKSARLDMAKSLALEWVASVPAVQNAFSKWKPPKGKDHLKFIGYAMGILLAAQPRGLTPKSWHVILLSSLICAELQKESTTHAFPLGVILRKEMVETTHRYLQTIEVLQHLYRILNLHLELNEHAFFSASVFCHVMAKYPWTKSTLQHALRDPIFGLNDDQVRDCSWGYYTIFHLYSTCLPADPSPPLTPAIVLNRNPAAAQKLKPKKLPPPKSVEASEAPTASPQGIDPLDWEDEVVSTPRAPPPKDLKDLIVTLPVFNHKEEILTHVAANPIVIIQGETGCGKSTSVPQFLLDSNSETAKIYVTQPRRVAAITLATTVAKMREQTVGQTIGYRVGQIQKDSDETQITYVTTGYMLERLVHNAESVSRVTHLILDEAHERSMDMDMLLLMLATHWHMWPDLKLIIMSATMDSSIFFKYFKPKLPYPLKQKEELFVGSALHPVRSIYLEDMKGMKELKVGKLVESLNSWTRADMNDIEVVIKKLQNIVNPQLELCARIAKTIVDTQKGTGCILIFVSGLTDIQFLHEQFEKWSSIKLFVLHSDIELDDQAKAFEGVDRKTKIILSTNIAESSVTIPDVTHIINTGLEKQIVMHSQSRSEILVRSWCSRASVKQRSGRAGRIQPGVAYHLFTKQFMETCMDEYTTPELLRKPLDKVVLQLKSQLHHIGTPTELLSKAISVPDLANIQSAFNVLHLFSAVESPNEKDAITSFGAFSVHFPLDIRLCRLLMYGLSASDWGIGVVDVVLLVAVMASPDLHLAPSRFHTPSAAKYLNDMKLSLMAKLDLQEGNVWSESLAMWQLMVQCLTCKSKGEVISLLKNFAISFRRFQTTLVLVGEICSRLMRLAKTPQYKNIRVLNVAAIKQLSLLQKFSARMYSPEPWKYSHAPLPIMRLLIVLNYSDCLARGRLPDNKKGESMGKKNSEPLLSLALKVDSSCAWGTNIPAHHFKKLLDALVRESEDMNVVKGSSLFDIKYRQSNPVPFSASLLYFLRDRRFPVDLPVDPLWKPAVGDPDALRVRFTDAGFRPGGVLSWSQWTSGIKLNVSGRSVFGLPQAKLQKKVVAAIFSEQLLTGDGSMMMCGGCTMLPPDVESYAAIVMLMTAKRNVWIFVDSKLQYWSAIKVDGCNCSLDDCVALHPTLDTINLVRRELSRGLVQSLPTARDPVARISGEDMDALFKTEKQKLDGMKWIQLDFDTSTKLPFPPLVVG